MSYADLSEEQKENRRAAVDKYRKSRRGRPRTRTPEQKRAQQLQASRRAYAKKTGKPWVKRHVNQYGEVDRIGNIKRAGGVMRYSDLSEERKEARREAAREWKARNRARRVAEGYVGKPIRHPKPKGKPKQYHAALDAWWEKLKKKHEGQPRLTHSIKPPIFLGPDKGIGR